MKKEKLLSLEEESTSIKSAFYFFGFMALVIYSLSSLSNILTPIALAILIWFLINALAEFLKKLPFMDSNFGQAIAMPLTLVTIVILMMLIGGFIGSSIAELGSSVSLIDDKVKELLERISKMTSYNIMEPIQKLFEQFSIASVINKAIAAFTNIFGNIVQIMLYVLFLLIDQKFFNQKMNMLFPKNMHRVQAKEVLSSISKTIKMYLSITTVISLLTGFLTYVICAVFGLKGAVLWGFIAFILNFIPTIGSIIAVAFPTLYGFIQFSNIFDVLILLSCLGAIQFTIGNVIYPKLMGNKLNISQFVVILSLVLWGAMWGTIGMFLSVPLMVIVMIVLSQFESTKAVAILISEDGNIQMNK